MTAPRTLPADVHRCIGVGFEEDGVMEWREGCEDCLRRTSPPVDIERVRRITPPAIIVFECEYREPPDGA
jgi:hypothetical protein